MSKFIVTVINGDYEPTMKSYEADDLKDLLMMFMDREDYETDADWAEDIGLPKNFTGDDVIHHFQKENGSDGAYITVWDCDFDRQVI